MSRKNWITRPNLDPRPPGKTEIATLATMFPSESRRRPRVCSICLDADAELVKGVCADRAACEKRQPVLFGEEEL